MKIQEMTLNGERVGSERRTVPDIGDGVEAFVANPRAGDVDAILRHEFFVAAQVDGRHGVLAAIAAATAGRGEDCEGAAQQLTRATDSTSGEKLANLTAGDAFAAQRHFVENLYSKSHLTAKFGERVHVAGSFVSETEVVAFVNFRGVQLFFEDSLGKLARGQQGEIASEGKQEDGIDAGAG